MKRIGVPMTACAAGLLLSACAQQPLYTEPYASVQPASLSTPQAVTLNVSYTLDGKRDPKREQQLDQALAAALDAGGVFKVAATGGADIGRLDLSVSNGAGGKSGSLLGGFSATVGHALVSQPEFTPQGRRTTRELLVHVSYTPAGGVALSHDYTSKLITITNNTQEPTDLVALPDTAHGEVMLVSNDLNSFAADFAAAQSASAH